MSDPKPKAKAGDDVDVELGQMNSLASEVMNNPETLALVQAKLTGMVGTLSGYYDTLPKVVKRRVKALKKLQVEALNIEAKLQQEIHALECKYAKLYDPLHLKRKAIVNAEVEPTDEECDFPSDEEEEDEEKKDAEKPTENAKEEPKSDLDENTKGIPEFWLTIFKNVEIIAENIQEHDEPILQHLTEVKVNLSESPMGFNLEFHFSANEYFTNEVLTKQYELKCVPDENDPFSFEGAEIVKSKGCEINWKKGKNVTVKTIIKKQKHKSKGSVRTVPKTVPNDSFFNFFSPPDIPENEDDLDDETQALLAADFEIGEVIRQRLVPRAVLYFTGEALVDEDYDEDDEDEEDEDEEDSEEDEEENAPESDRKGKRKTARGNAKDPQECQQQ